MRKDSGVREGIAKSLSQACVYGLETQKTLLQVYGKSSLPNAKQWITGAITSSLTSGLVFGTYFSVHNSLHPMWYAGIAAAFTTSFLKIPISNGMRLMQAGAARNIVCATRKIVRSHGVRGLYTGYSLSLLEDIIEFDVRARLYKELSNVNRKNDAGISRAIGGGVLGGLAGSIAAGLTTPFDTIRAHLAMEAGKNKNAITPVKTIQKLVGKRGIRGLYKGVSYRMSSNALKNALFFAFFEVLADLP